LSLKVIAHRAGYSHVSNFIHAYRARFGAPPRASMRRIPRN
jgi:AraC-like DNA-binding protein